MSNLSLGEKIIRWGKAERSVELMILIGSRSVASKFNLADQWSDWDFQIVTTKPETFDAPDWVRAAGISQPIAYVKREGRLGHTAKVTSVFPEGDLDLVLIPASKLMLLKWLTKAKLAVYFPRARTALRDLSLVLRYGHRIEKSTSKWEEFIRSINADTSQLLLDDSTICAMADGYVCDYMSTVYKIRRGEYVAAQRWLHLHLGETNFRLLHDLNLRLGATSFPDGRRFEAIASAKWRHALTIEASPDCESLTKALARSAETLRELMSALVGPKWTWPDLSARLR